MLNSRAMSSELELQCRCAAMRGTVGDVGPSNSTHAICYCDDCQAFARWLAIDGITDPHGGTEILQVSPSQIRWTHGTEHLRCMRLSPKGMIRWYCDACRTPVGNTVSARVPFVGIPCIAFVDLPVDAVGLAVGVQARFATNGPPPGAYARAPLGIVVHAARMLARWWIRGKGRPSPYFDDDGVPRSAPVVLDRATRDRLRPFS